MGEGNAAAHDSADGAKILLRVTTEQGGHVDLSFPTVDLQHLVILLLMLDGKCAPSPALAGGVPAQSSLLRRG